MHVPFRFVEDALVPGVAGSRLPDAGEEVFIMTKMSVRKPGAIRLTARCAYYCPCCG